MGTVWLLVKWWHRPRLLLYQLLSTRLVSLTLSLSLLSTKWGRPCQEAGCSTLMVRSSLVPLPLRHGASGCCVWCVTDCSCVFHHTDLSCHAVPGRPTKVAVTPVSTSALSVSWTAPHQPLNAPPVLYYTVSWRREGAEGGSDNVNRTTNTTYKLTGLAQGTRYTVNVTAHNSVGESEVATGSNTTLSGEWSVYVCQH